MKKIVIISALLTVILCGCGQNGFENKTDKMPEQINSQEITDILTEDESGNDYTGSFIMETDSGYYYNSVQNILSLRYTEKSTGADIFLCAKPECMHDGNKTCTATYDFLVISNMVLYDNYIYFVSEENEGDLKGCALYKISLDGSSLDKVGDIKKVKAPVSGNNGIGSMPYFVIYRGYAYIPYEIGENNYGGFIECGFAKMDIKTGSVELISSYDDFFSAVHTRVNTACGNYIYYDTSTQSGDFTVSRYNINDGTTENFFGSIKAIKEGKAGITAYTNDTLYLEYADGDHRLVVEGYDSKTFEPNGVKICSEEFNLASTVLIYDKKIYICGAKSVKVYSDKGELLNEISCEGSGIEYHEDMDTYYYDSRQFAISHGKLYIGYYKSENNSFDNDMYVYSYPIDKIPDNSGSWEYAYTVKSWDNYWKENPIITKLGRN